MDRRKFLKTSVAGTAGASLLPSLTLGAAHYDNPGTMVYRNLGKTGLKLPVISMGVMRSDNPNLVKAALKAGIKYLDTAHGYQGGRNEEMLGNLLKDYPRDSFIISTKIKGQGMDNDTGKFTGNISTQAFIDDFYLSLERLKMKYVDIVFLHGVSTKDAVLFEPYITLMQQLRKESIARFIGVSTHKNEPEVLRAAAHSGIYDVVLTAINFQQDHFHDVKDAVAEAASEGLGIVAMKTLAGGFADRERKVPVDARAAIKYVLQDENIHTVIPGFTTFEELETTMSVMQDFELHKEEIETLDKLKSQGSIYCNGCSHCVPNCRKKLPVPEIMRSYMYAYGYNQKLEAQHLLKSLNINDNPCGDCTDCTVNCVKQFNVRQKISDITRIKNIPSEFLA
jgi:uncharacterized protein